MVGYGSMKKESLTGSVTVVDQKLFKDKGTVANPLSAMQGQVPGLRITRSSAAPGEEGWGVSIRGSVSKNKVEPLLIIDGVPASGVSEMAQLNADDIETINFLKDASAAIYGAKAAGLSRKDRATSCCRRKSRADSFPSLFESDGWFPAFATGPLVYEKDETRQVRGICGR